MDEHQKKKLEDYCRFLKEINNSTNDGGKGNTNKLSVNVFEKQRTNQLKRKAREIYVRCYMMSLLFAKGYGFYLEQPRKHSKNTNQVQIIRIEKFTDVGMVTIYLKETVIKELEEQSVKKQLLNVEWLKCLDNKLITLLEEEGFEIESQNKANIKDQFIRKNVLNITTQTNNEKSIYNKSVILAEGKCLYEKIQEQFIKSETPVLRLFNPQ